MRVRTCLLLFLALFVGLPMMYGQDGNPNPERAKRRAAEQEAIKADLLASGDFQAWVAAVGSHTGWQGEEADKANPNRVRVHGVYWINSAVVAALPRQAMTVDEMPTVSGVVLEFEHGPMTKWEFDLPGSRLPNADFYIWNGQRAPRRFQFSFVMSEGPKRWG